VTATDSPAPLPAQLTGELLDLAVRAAEAGGAELLARRGAVMEILYKTTATDPVSEADRASEGVITALLTTARPADGLLGEEGAARESGSGLRWVVDPLDGTVNYLYGMPQFAVSVACEQRYGDEWRAVVGAVHDPVGGETFTAVAGAGARLGDRLLRVNDPVPLERALVATGFGYSAESRRRQAAVAADVLPRVRDLRRVGSAALDLCWLAAGRFDGYYEDESSRWDWAAGALVATEAGALVSPLGNGLVAAGPALHAQLAGAVSALARRG
jgi:myo-inositol-1(or 4)-monophosphatase